MVILVYTTSPACLRSEIVDRHIASMLSTKTVAVYIPTNIL